MSHIRSRDTRPETMVRHYLFSRGFRYRKNVRALPGTPDIVLGRYVSGMGMRGAAIFACRRQMPTSGSRRLSAIRRAMPGFGWS